MGMSCDKKPRPALRPALVGPGLDRSPRIGWSFEKTMQICRRCALESKNPKRIKNASSSSQTLTVAIFRKDEPSYKARLVMFINFAIVGYYSIWFIIFHLHLFVFIWLT
jgi:hypothetical protein